MKSTTQLVLVACVLLASPGCLSSKYKSAGADLPTTEVLMATAGPATTANPVRLSVDSLGIVVLNDHRALHIEEDFDRRRLEPPVILTRGQMVQGGQVFRVAPSFPVATQP